MHSQRIRRFHDSRAEAMTYLKSINTPHWLLVSEQLRDGSGLDLLRDGKHLHAGHRGRRLGVDACLNERSVELRDGALIAALTAMKQGRHFVDPSLVDAERVQSETPKMLSERQLEILGLVAEGLSNREIADRLHISVNTARDHLSEILTRLDVGNRASAVSAALRLGLIP